MENKILQYFICTINTYAGKQELFVNMIGHMSNVSLLRQAHEAFCHLTQLYTTYSCAFLKKKKVWQPDPSQDIKFSALKKERQRAKTKT